MADLNGEITPINPIGSELEPIEVIEGEVVTTQELEGEISAEGEVEGSVGMPAFVYEKNYEILDNKPSINGHELIGDQTTEELDIVSAKLKAALEAVVTVGGVSEGTNYSEGTELEKIMRDMLSPVLYPTLVNPSASISVASPVRLLEKGDTLSTTATINLNRGSITPPYGTSGYRSGPASSYSLNGGPFQAENSFFVTITEQLTSLAGSVSYLEGEQPKNSIGEDYDDPLPAGSAQTNTVTYEFVNALWANTSNIQNVTKQALVSFSAKLKEFIFPEQTPLYPEIFDAPSSWTITAIEVLNTLSNQWENVAFEFVVTNIVHNDAAGNEVTYKRYTDNRGYAAGSRKIRIKWR